MVASCFRGREVTNTQCTMPVCPHCLFRCCSFSFWKLASFKFTWENTMFTRDAIQSGRLQCFHSSWSGALKAITKSGFRSVTENRLKTHSTFQNRRAWKKKKKAYRYVNVCVCACVHTHYIILSAFNLLAFKDEKKKMYVCTQVNKVSLEQITQH